MRMKNPDKVLRVELPSGIRKNVKRIDNEPAFAVITVGVRGAAQQTTTIAIDVEDAHAIIERLAWMLRDADGWCDEDKALVDGDLMTVDYFAECVRDGGFIDYDGVGDYVREVDGQRQVHMRRAYPSDFRENGAPEGATHVLWFNR